MFTGIVQALGTIESAVPTAAGRRLVIGLGDLSQAPSHGDSVCVSGVCLTVVKCEGAREGQGGGQGGRVAHFDVVTETLQHSTLGDKRAQDRVNLELSLRGDSFVGGHFVQGHVDAMARVAAIQRNARDWRITFAVPAACMVYIVPKGSIAVDGVSMTIAEVAGETFTLAVIPTTLEKTTLAQLRVGDAINVETDILARTVVHFLMSSRGTAGPAAAGMTLVKLQELGMA